jgi:hypothetical protein
LVSIASSVAVEKLVLQEAVLGLFGESGCLSPGGCAACRDFDHSS